MAEKEELTASDHTASRLAGILSDVLDTDMPFDLQVHSAFPFQGLTSTFGAEQLGSAVLVSCNGFVSTTPVHAWVRVSPVICRCVFSP